MTPINLRHIIPSGGANPCTDNAVHSQILLIYNRQLSQSGITIGLVKEIRIIGDRSAEVGTVIGFGDLRQKGRKLLLKNLSKNRLNIKR